MREFVASRRKPYIFPKARARHTKPEMPKFFTGEQVSVLGDGTEAKFSAGMRRAVAEGKGCGVESLPARTVKQTPQSPYNGGIFAVGKPGHEMKREMPKESARMVRYLKQKQTEELQRALYGIPEPPKPKIEDRPRSQHFRGMDVLHALALEEDRHRDQMAMEKEAWKVRQVTPATEEDKTPLDRSPHRVFLMGVFGERDRG